MSDKLSASEAIFAFTAWLTSLDEPVTLSAGHDAGLAAELAREFCDHNGLSDPRWDFGERFNFPTTRRLFDISKESNGPPTFKEP